MTLALGEHLRIDFQLELGSATESVTVTTEAPLLDTSSVSTGRALSNREVMDLPVLGNNITMLTRFTPGVQVGTTQFLVQGQVGGGRKYNAPGGVGGNEWSLDGASTNGTDRRVSIMPSPDTIDEFKIETSNFDAAFGHSTGLNIAMSTKSGGNVLRGTERFNASTRTGTSRPTSSNRRVPRSSPRRRRRVTRDRSVERHAAAATRRDAELSREHWRSRVLPVCSMAGTGCSSSLAFRS